MKRLTWLALVGIVSSMILFGCKGEDGPQGPAGTALTGNFHGKVQAYDNFGSYLGFMAGVQVTAEGTGYTAISDSLGAYVITGLPMGTYNFVLTKNGFGLMKITQIQFVGGDFYYGTTSIVGLPNFEASTVTASFTAGTLNVAGTVTGTPPLSRRAYVFIGKTSAVSSTNPFSYVLASGRSIAASTNTFAYAIAASTLVDSYGFATGDTVYIAAYSASTQITGYYDYAAGITVYSGLGSIAKTTSAVIP